MSCRGCLLALFTTLMLSSCGGAGGVRRLKSGYRVHEREARLGDVSLVADAEVGAQESDERIFTYKTVSPVDEIVAFYEQDMEYFGWRKIGVFVDSHGMTMVFEKPHKTCVICGDRCGGSSKKHRVRVMVCAR